MSASESAGDYSLGDLRSMSRDEAMSELDPASWERWKALQERLDAAEDTREAWRDADETVLDVTVHADDADLGETVDVFGNDLLVRIDPEKPALRKRANALEAEFGDDGREVGELDDADTDRLAGRILDLYREIIVAWNGTRLDDMTPPERDTLFETIREKWGLRGLFLGLADIIAGVEQGQKDRLEAVDSFRGAEGRRRR
jgi:23S rRNA G2069 N7-methylase RlmK/C1962 C5-methylase RlmI